MKQPQLQYYDLGNGITAFSTTRHGGYSTGNYADFNINHYCGDCEEDIRKNREALCSLLGISNDRLLMPHQVHLTKTVKVDEALIALPSGKQQEALEGYDAVMTDLDGVCIGVSTADCIPILLHDTIHHAICAIHAGWRGTVGRIAEKAIAEMTAAYGTHPEQIRAQIGPGIHLDAFEVGDEVYEAFLQAAFDMPAISKRYPQQDKWHIDLPECNRLQLLASGIPSGAIAVSPICTYQQSADYFSARRLGIHSGRIFTGILRIS